MVIVYEALLAMATVMVILMLHDRALRVISKRCKKTTMTVVMMVLALLHTVHIWIYAVSIYAAVNWFHLGNIKGRHLDTLLDYVYFSATNYTSLGYGDYIADDGVRLLATFEGLIGLLLIGWSTAFAFWWMQRHWLSELK